MLFVGPATNEGWERATGMPGRVFSRPLLWVRLGLFIHPGVPGKALIPSYGVIAMRLVQDIVLVACLLFTFSTANAANLVSPLEELLHHINSTLHKVLADSHR